MKSQLALFCITLIFLTGLSALWSCNNITQKPSPLTKVPDLIVAEQLKNKGSYDSAILFFRKAAEYNLKINQNTGWVTGMSGLIDCYRLKGDINEAMHLLEQTLSIANSKLDTTENLYNNLILKKANLLSDQHQFKDAVLLYNRNIRIYTARTTPPDTGLALAYNGLGTVNLLQNKYTAALDEYKKAIETYEKARHTKNTNYTGSLQNIGIVYSMRGNFEKAEQFFLKSLKINQEVLLPNDPKLASLYLNMGRFYQIVRNDLKAIEYMKQAESFYISQNQSNSVTAGVLYLNMGAIYIYSADYEKAQNYLNKSLEIISSKAPGDKANLLNIYLNMGIIAEKKGDYTFAKDNYLKGLAIGDKLTNSVKVLRSLANVSAKMSDNLNANLYHKGALNKSIEMFGENNPETALTYLRYGDFLSLTEDSQALHYLNMSLNHYIKSFGRESIDVSTAYYYIGNYYFRAKNYTTALNNFQLSLIAGFPGFKSLNFSDNPEITKANLNDNLLNPLTAKATALLLLYLSDTSKLVNLESSAKSFNLSLKLIEMLRATYLEEDSKLFISGNEKKTFSNALLAQMLIFRKTKNPEALKQAFSLCEKGKSAVLLSHLRDKEAKNIGRIPEKLQSQDASLKSEIYFYNKQIHDQQLSTAPDETKIKMWNSRIFDLSRKQEYLIKSIEKDYPAYYNLKYDNSVIDIDHVQKKLSSGQALVEFTLTDSTLYTFAVNSGKKQIVTTAINKSFFNNISLLREQLNGKDFNNYTKNDFRKFVRASYYLYKTLLLPVQAITKGKELIIIPDGELGYISFDVLLTSMPDTTKQAYKRLPYLIKQSALTYAPSATTFFDGLNTKVARNNGRILAYSPDYGPNNTVLDQKDENGNLLRNSLSQLDNTSAEINNLKSQFNVSDYLDKKATETSFKKNAADYRVLHLAMHTIINDENPLYSKLIFYKSKADTIDDGMLNASELVNMDLHAEIAVLSACNTGSGKMRKGEGIMSLSRDFFYAGVPGIIMTSWAVEDRSGVVLMEYFYKYISQGKPRHEALRLAKLEYLENCDKLTAHPHYWAAYMNVGDISPLEGFAKKTTPVSLYIATAALLSIALFLLIYLFKKHKSKNAAS